MPFSFSIIRKTSLFALSSAYLLGMAVLSLCAVSSKDLPDPKKLWEKQRPVSVQILDRQGREVLVRGAGLDRPVDMEALPFHIPMTILAIEDRRYYNHIGVDPRAIARATVRNIKAGRYVEGGSTLTQQLSKNIFLTPDKTMGRKIQEAMIAIWLERDFTKDELLEMYLSRVYFGSGSWGLENASHRYFNKPAGDLTLAEAAMLAGLLQSPSTKNPVSHFDRALTRQHIVLESMQSQNLLEDGILQMAKTEPLSIHKPADTDGAQYFVDWIWSSLEEKIGIPTQDIVVQTTLDLDAQSDAQIALEANIDADRNATQGAIISLDGTAGVRVMVGGLDYSESQFNRATQAVRQPGSAFKPFVYLAALRAGKSPWSLTVDAPITIEDWSPNNFSEEHMGSVTYSTAFAKSLNTVAVNIGETIGRDRVISLAEQFGLSDLKPYRSLALGAQGQTPLAMTESYLPFANWGKRRDAYGILTISTLDGSPLYDRTSPPGLSVLSAQELADMNHMMVDVVTRGTGRRARIDNHTIAGKTGTTNDFRDAWFIGFTPDRVTGVWVGNDDNSPMDDVTGGSIPAKIFAESMKGQLKTIPEARLPVSSKPDWARKDAQLNSLLDRIEGRLP